jgi:hypothetical protein
MTNFFYYNGLCGTRYVGYYNDNPNWFLTASPQGDTNSLSSIDRFTSSTQTNQDNYSWEWIGYFKANSNEAYTFYTSSDDSSFLWLGNAAASGYLTSNALVNNGGLHGKLEKQGTTSNPLVSGQYYPIRIQYGEKTGGDIITISFSTNTKSKTTNGTGYFFSAVNCGGTPDSTIYLGSSKISSIMLGNSLVSKIYLGETRIF